MATANSHGVYGSPVGEIAYADMKQDEASAQLALAQAAIIPAHGRLYNAQAAKLEEEAAQEQLLRQLTTKAGIAGQQTGQGDSPERDMPSQLDNLAELALGAGLFTKGIEFAKAASTVRSGNARAGSANANARKLELDAMRSKAGMLGRTFGTVKNQSELDEANKFYTFNTGEESPYEGQMYSPGLIENIRKNSLTVREQADLEERRLTRENNKNYRDSRLGQMDAANRVRKILADIARNREMRLAKTGGGKDVVGPSTAETKQAKQLITKDFPALEAGDLNEAAYAVAAEARALRRANNALSADEALRRAYVKAQRSGDFVAGSGFLGIDALGRKDRFSGGGKSPESPALIPSDTGKLVKDKYYVNDNGLVAKWNGKSFVVVGGGRPLSTDKGSLNDGPDNEEDDDEDD